MRSVDTGSATPSTTQPSTTPAAAALDGGSRLALWPALVFEFAGLYAQARRSGLGQFRTGRHYAAATWSTLTWCVVLSEGYLAAHPVPRRPFARSGHFGLSHIAVQRIELLLLAAVIVGIAALVEPPSGPSGPKGRLPRN